MPGWFRFGRLGAGVLGCLPATTTVGHAQEPVSDIVVTAQHRAEPLQDVPVSIAPISGEDLFERNVRTFEDLAGEVPGLVVTQSVNYGFAPLSIRGVGGANGGGNIFADEPVAVYQDGAFVARLRMPTQDLLDIERVEVLRGPQGVLFGRNSTGGAVLLHSAEPTRDYRALVGMSGSLPAAYRANAALSGPLDDARKLLARVAVGRSQRDGFGSNRAGRRPNGGHDARARLFVRFEPTARHRLDLISEVSRSLNRPGTVALSDLLHLTDERAGTPGDNLVTPGRPRADLSDVIDDLRYALNFPSFTRVDGHSVTGRLQAPLGGAQLSAITNYRSWKVRGAQDSDGNAIDPPSPPFVAAPIANLGDNTARLDDWQVSQELRVASPGDWALSWLAGLYYIHERNRADPVVVNNRLAGAGGGGTAAIFRARQKMDSFAAYASLSWRVSETLTASAALRYTHERKSYRSAFEVRQIETFDPPGDAIFVAGQLLARPPDLEKSRSFDDLSTRFVLEWQARPALMVYASHSSGFKSGGYNAFRGIDPAFDEETIDAIELGVKADPARWLRVNASAFHYVYRGLQVRIPVATGGIGIENLPRARIFGGELEASVSSTSGLRFELGLALLDTRIHEGRLSALAVESFVLGTAPPVIQRDVAGNRLTRAPALQANLTAVYRRRLGTLEASGRIALRHQSGVRFLESQQPSATFSARGWQRLDARIALGSAGDDWEVAVFADNLTNERHLSQVTAFFGLPNGVISPPRRTGLQLTLRHR